MNNRVAVVLSGELDLASAPELDAQLAALDEDIVIDCAGLTFIDASGLRVLLSAQRRCNDRNRRLTLIHPPACLTRLLAITDLDAVFHIQTVPPGR